MWHLVYVHPPFLSPVMRVQVQKWLFQNISKAILIQSFRASLGMTKTDDKNFAEQRSNVSFGFWWLVHRVAIYQYWGTVYDLYACFDDLSTLKCNFEKGPSSKSFPEPYKKAFLKKNFMFCTGEETPSSCIPSQPPSTAPTRDQYWVGWLASPSQRVP